MTENEILHAMKALDLSREEAIQMLKDDDAIDHGAKLFELSDEQKKVEKKMKNVSRAPTAYKFSKRERKPNEAKRELISNLAEFLSSVATNIEITNAEREMLFNYNGIKYRLTLAVPRS